VEKKLPHVLASDCHLFCSLSLQQWRWAPKLARLLHGRFLQAWDQKNLPKRWEAVMNNREYIIDWLFVWKINYLEALKNRTNLCTNPILLISQITSSQYTTCTFKSTQYLNFKKYLPVSIAIRLHRLGDWAISGRFLTAWYKMLWVYNTFSNPQKRTHECNQGFNLEYKIIKECYFSLRERNFRSQDEAQTIPTFSTPQKPLSRNCVKIYHHPRFSF
jgi:hypothetical protein